MKHLSWFFRPRTIWCPTLLGWALILSAIAAPFAAWWTWGESYLSLSAPRTTSEIMVVEGWAGPETIEGAAEAFSIGGFQWIVAAGGPTGGRRNHRRQTYADVAADGLIEAGIASEKIIPTPARDVETQRTYESAVAVQQTLAAKGLRPKNLTIFTRGAHARRSQLVYSKVFGRATQISVISWQPNSQHTKFWWQSSTRAKDFFTETLGLVYEAWFDSGRKDEKAIAPQSRAAIKCMTQVAVILPPELFLI